MDDQLKQGTLDFHKFPVSGKVQISPTKPLATQCDLASAHPPGVAVPCLEIEEDPLAAYRYTAHGSLIAAISNDTAVLGLGSIGASAGEPVMEGKDVLFKKFVGIDVFDIEVDKLDPDKFINVVTALEPTFGGTNLGDIKAPGCFYTEQELCERMNIPVSHNDQYDTAVISTTAILNGPRVVKKNTSDARTVVSGADAVVITRMDLLVVLGAQEYNVVVHNSRGMIYKDRRPDMTETRVVYAVIGDGKRTLDDVIDGVDISLDCSGPKVPIQGMIKKAAHAPMILALVNPEPEILPPLTEKVRSNAIICTGRSDYPNQVNDVLCFPSVFRGALDVDAVTINEEMKSATVHATAELTHAEQSEVAASAYDDQDPNFDPRYIILKPFDPHLVVKIAPVVTETAMDSGVTTHPIADSDAYIDELTKFVCKINLFVKPISPPTRRALRRVVLIEEEEARILRATQELITLGPVRPILARYLSVVEIRIQKLGLQIKAGADFEAVDNESDLHFKECWGEYCQVMKRCGIAQEQVQRAAITNTTVIDAIMVQRGEADATTCGMIGDYHERFSVVKEVSGCRDGVHTVGAMSTLLLLSGNIFITDTYVDDDPTPKQLTEVAVMTAETVRRFDIEPKVALLSHSDFGSSNCLPASKVRDALELTETCALELMVDGEMHGDAALVESIRGGRIPDNPLKGLANILMMPNMEATRISYNLLRVSSSESVTVDPVLVGVAKLVHISTPIVSVRRIVDMVAFVVVETQIQPL